MKVEVEVAAGERKAPRGEEQEHSGWWAGVRQQGGGSRRCRWALLRKAGQRGALRRVETLGGNSNEAWGLSWQHPCWSQ